MTRPLFDLWVSFRDVACICLTSSTSSHLVVLCVAGVRCRRLCRRHKCLRIRLCQHPIPVTFTLGPFSRACQTTFGSISVSVFHFSTFHFILSYYQQEGVWASFYMVNFYLDLLSIFPNNTQFFVPARFLFKFLFSPSVGFIVHICQLPFKQALFWFIFLISQISLSILLTLFTDLLGVTPSLFLIWVYLIIFGVSLTLCSMNNRENKSEPVCFSKEQ